MSETPIERRVRAVLEEAARARAQRPQPLIVPESLTGVGIILAHAVLLVLAFLGGMRLAGPALSAFVLWPGLVGFVLQATAFAAGVRNRRVYAGLLIGSVLAVGVWLWSRTTGLSG